MNATIRRPSPLDAGSTWTTRRNQPVWKRHAPGNSRGFAIISITGDQASDSSDCVTDGGRRTANIQHGQHADAVFARQQQQGGDAGGEASEPGKAGAQPVKPFHAEELAKADAVIWGVNYVPQLGPDYARNSGINNDGLRINLQVAPPDFSMKRKKSSHESQPHQQPKRANSYRPNVNVRKQSETSMKELRDSITLVTFRAKRGIGFVIDNL